MIIGLWAERREVGAVASVLLLPTEGLLDVRVCCFSSGRIVGRCERWNICSSLTCSCLPLVLAWQATFTQGSVPSFYSLGGVFLTRPACTCQKRCQLSDFIFTVHTERLSDGQPISDSSGACADRWGYGGEIIVRSAPLHNACQAQTHL